MKRSLPIVGSAVVLILIVAGVFGWQRVAANSATGSPRVQTATVARGTLVATVNAAGNISAPTSAALGFPTSGHVAKTAVQLGDHVKVGQLLMQLDTTDLQLALQTAQTNLATAQANFDSARANAQFALRTAQANLAGAQANYDAAKAKYATNADQLTVAKAGLDKARVALDQAQAAYNMVAWRPDVGMTPQSAALQAATTDYNSAKATYDLTIAGINDTALRAAQASLDNAQVSLHQAQHNVDTSERAAQAALDNAKIALEQAQRNLDRASLYAPFDGIVSAVSFSAGDTAGSGTAVSLTDTQNLQVKVMIAEVDVAKVQVGGTAMVTADALPGRMFHGTVAAISPVGMVTQGVVDFPVIISVTSPEGDLKPGMTANLAVTVDRRENVLTVPLRAVRSQGSQKSVIVSYKGQSIAVPVTTGLASDTQVEITSGLNEGDVAVMNQTQTNSSVGQMQTQMLLMGGGGMGH